MRSRDMRIALPLISLGLLTQCHPVPPVLAPPPEKPAPTQAGIAETPPAKPPSPPVSAPRYAQKIINGITFQGVSFDSRSHQLSIADQSNGPGTEYQQASDAGQANSGIAAINGGFFTPEGKPLGLVVSNGNTAGYWNSASSLGSAAWHRPKNGIPRITRRETLGFKNAKGMQELLQSGPMLIDNSLSVTDLNKTNIRDRSIILWNGKNQWWIGITSPCSLNQLANSLSKHSPTPWTVKSALNLDGGSSCDLWVSGKIAGKPISSHSIWTRKVRNYLVLQSK